MASNSLQAMKLLVSNAASVISNLNQNYKIKEYAQTVDLKRGQYTVNIVPDTITTRVLTGYRSLPSITIDVVFYYVMDSDDNYGETWELFLDKANEILTSLYDQNNIPDSISTVKIELEFDNSLVDNTNYNLISVVMSCEYEKFATG